MATTKRAQYRFAVKEGPALIRETREGILESFCDPFIVAEPCGTEPAGERPLEDPDFFSFDLGPGLSPEEAQEVADFLNEHLMYIGITRFGDAEDAARDLEQSARLRQIELERFSGVTAELKERLAAGDTAGAREEVQGFESALRWLINDWSKCLATSREILRKFGQGEDHA